MRARLVLVAAVVALPLTLTVPAEAHNIAHCRYEDGPPPCVWDARHMGNGDGRSFRLFADGSKKWLTHRRAHYLAYHEHV